MTTSHEFIDLNNRFKHHPPDEVAVSRHSFVRKTLLDASLNVVEALSEGREKSLFLTKMEEAMFWANASIARESKV